MFKYRRRSPRPTRSAATQRPGGRWAHREEPRKNSYPKAIGGFLALSTLKAIVSHYLHRVVDWLLSHLDHFP